LSDPIHTKGDTLIGRYRIRRFRAEGGMQQVYEARDLSFDRTVALKVPKNTSAEKRFARSAQMSARVNHSNVAKTLDYFEENDRGYLVEELVEGTDLSARLTETFEVFDPHLAAHLVHHLARGAAAAHHAKVFHRDLKPSNIIVSDDPGLTVVKITDFGIAKMAKQEMSEAFKDIENTLTGSSTAMGALPYMAPEMVESPKTAALPADIWAIGAILYRLLAGVPPYGTGLRAVIRIAQANPPAKPVLLHKMKQFESIGQELWEIVQACLQKDPASRPDADKLMKMCSRLCYSHSTRKIGTIESFRAGTGDWGSIRADDGTGVFFPGHSFYGEKPEAGMRVNFASYRGWPKPRAFPVLPIKQ
jgi:eukaryotic-like serine/threonine-protein kinase